VMMAMVPVQMVAVQDFSRYGSLAPLGGLDVGAFALLPLSRLTPRLFLLFPFQLCLYLDNVHMLQICASVCFVC
jgi:hypothetical protein